jgi:flavodoxin
MKPKILVVYFSRTGHTRQIATALARALPADLEELREPRAERSWLRSALDGFLGRRTMLQPVAHVARDYDLVVVGGPVWVGALSSPVRTYLDAHRGQFREIAFFCSGGGAPGSVFEQMARITGMRPKATLAVLGEEQIEGLDRPKLEAFVRALAPLAATG